MRFPEAMHAGRWRTEADRRGLEPDLDAWAMDSALLARESLPPDCFLSVAIEARALLRERVRAVLARALRLDGLVIEVACGRPSASGRPVDDDVLAEAVGELRAAGAAIALDLEGGAGALGIALLRPEFVKLPSRLVVGLHRDDVKRTVLEAVGQLAGRLDAWVIARGIEQIGELDALLGLGVPLGQGPLIGVRGKTLTPVAFVLSAYVRDRGGKRIAPGPLAALLEPVPAMAPDRAEVGRAYAADPALWHVVLVAPGGRPTGMVERRAFERGDPLGEQVMTVAPSSGLAEVARRAMLRPLATRFHPLVCCDPGGRCVGIVRIERLIAALASAEGPGGEL